MATNQQRLTTSQVAGILGITPQGVRQRVARGTLIPSETLANGHHLFSPEQITPRDESPESAA